MVESTPQILNARQLMLESPDVVHQAVKCKKQAKIACQTVHDRKYRPDIACPAVPGGGSMGLKLHASQCMVKY
jgi:hypothetical protein